MGGTWRDEFEEAFDGLFERAHRVACRVLDYHEAEDAAAEAVARAYLHWRQVRDLPYRDAWVARVAANVAIDCLRRTQRRRRRLFLATAVPDPTDHVADWLLVIQAVDRLPSRQRDVMVLRYVADLSERQVAAELGVGAATVKEHADRARASLRSTLGTGWEERHAAVQR